MHDLKAAVARRGDEIIRLRRELHQIPEPAYTEEKTSKYIAGKLNQLGIEVRSGVARYGVIGIERFQRPGKTLMLRSELDALTIPERTGLPFVSQHPDAMHACGHDGHMAMVLGAAIVLHDLSPDLGGAIKFVFQPAEEGPGGAAPMIAEGVLENPDVDMVLGLHLWPGIPKGTVGIRPGPVMAAMDRFDLFIRGKGGHGAMPHLCVDALEIGTQVVAALQRIVSRQMNPLQPAVLTVGEFQAGSAFNVTAAEARLSGTTRTFDSAVWHSWAERIERVVSGVCAAMGAEYQLDYQPGYPVTINDEWTSEKMRDWAAAVVGPDAVLTPEPSMGGEDFSFYLQRTRGCFAFLGVGRPDGAPLHSPFFDFSEDILLTGVEIYCRAALDVLAPDTI